MIEWTLDKGVYELTLGQDPCNEIGTTFLARFEEFLDTVRVDQAHTLILHSTVAKGFCAGADLRELYAGICERPRAEHVDAVRDFLDRIHR